MKDIQHASAVVSVPAGFSGYWCERCEKACPAIPPEAGTPAKCPHCRKWTVVWVPGQMSNDEVRMTNPHGNYQRTRPAADVAKQLFDEMRAAVLADSHQSTADTDGYIA